MGGYLYEEGYFTINTDNDSYAFLGRMWFYRGSGGFCRGAKFHGPHRANRPGHRGKLSLRRNARNPEPADDLAIAMGSEAICDLGSVQFSLSLPETWDYEIRNVTIAGEHDDRCHRLLEHRIPGGYLYSGLCSRPGDLRYRCHQ